MYLLAICVELDRDEVIISFGELRVLDCDLKCVVAIHRNIIKNGFEPSSASGRDSDSSGSRVLHPFARQCQLHSQCAADWQEDRQRLGKSA